MGQCQPALLFRQAAAVNVELAGSPRQEVRPEAGAAEGGDGGGGQWVGHSQG